jgi:hypothetical protein
VRAFGPFRSSFASKDERLGYLKRLPHSIAPKVHSLGLTRVDDEGVVWKKEWDNE